MRALPTAAAPVLPRRNVAPRRLVRRIPISLVVALLGVGCAGRPATTELPLVTTTLTVTPPATRTPGAASTAEPPGPTPPPPDRFEAELRPGIEPAGYLEDACEAMRLRWNPDGSAPGTVVLPIMFHSIREPERMVADNVTVSTEYFEATIALAQSLGFETITSEELLSFLTQNARIPPRSMMLIVDDRRPGVIAEYVLPVAEAYDWTVTLGWIIGDTRPSLWATMETLAESGRLDVQSHGLNHVYVVDGMSDEEMREEISGAIPILEEHFGYRPTAYVWPGGNFNRRSVEIAREAGFRLGFTAFSRGPLLFDWIPLGPEEQAVGDPLMVLPRAWSPSATANLVQAAELGDQAAEFARANRTTEEAWYRHACGGELFAAA